MHRRSPVRGRLAAVAVAPALTLAAAACSDDEPQRADIETVQSDEHETTSTEDEDESTSTVDEETAATETSPTTDEPPGTEPPATDAPTTEPESTMAASTVESDDEPQEPLAVVRGQQPWPELRIMDLRRHGETVTLDFVIVTGEGEPNITFAFSAWNAASAYDVSGVSLIDHANRKRYLVLQDTENNCLCTAFDHLDEIQENTPYVHSAQFPAPPAGVEEMSIAVPKFAIVDGVPLRSEGG